MEKHDDLSVKGKRNIDELLTVIFKFSNEELAAIDEQQPMTQELYNSCLDKCMQLGTDNLFYELLNKYPKFMTEYAKTIEEEIKDVELPKKTPEEEAKSWKQLCERIRKEYGNDTI